MIAVSRTGLAIRPGTEVLPTCSIEIMGISFNMSWRCSLAFANSVSQLGLWGERWTFMFRGRAGIVVISGEFFGGYIWRGGNKQMRGEPYLHEDGLRGDVEPKACKTVRYKRPDLSSLNL